MIHKKKTSIPVIDIFAGPGGLGEGFACYENLPGRRPFKVCLSVEKDLNAHRTLELRSFFRQFFPNTVPDAYYAYLRSEISRDELFELYPYEAELARSEALHRELGMHNNEIDGRIEQIFSDDNSQPWILIGGPPCQAYSIVGRSRIKNANPEKYRTDERHVLYREYLRILVKFRPCIFVMENVTGILSSKLNGKKIIDQILRDLRNPSAALVNGELHSLSEIKPEYRIYSLVSNRLDLRLELEKAQDAIIECERYGIPQRRHRVILLGVHNSVDVAPETLTEIRKQVSIESVIADLPMLRSSISKKTDDGNAWRDAVASLVTRDWFSEICADELQDRIYQAVGKLDPRTPVGAPFMEWASKPKYRPDWYKDDRLGGICNHVSRPHMLEDLFRYLFAACYAEQHGVTPVLGKLPGKLLPNHKNAEMAAKINGLFNDRFRVQIRTRPATTVTSHISKDGHYFIHYDPRQCRSLTVREAARIQTFPDNYFFEGKRTSQYHQVGNAVPPLLAVQIAGIVDRLLKQASESGKLNGYVKSKEEKLEHVQNSVEGYEGGEVGALIPAQEGLSVSSSRRETAG